MANVIQMTYDVKLDSAVRAFVQSAQKIAANEEALKALTKETAKAGRELERAAAAGASGFEKTRGGIRGAQQAVSGMVGDIAAMAAGMLSFGKLAELTVGTFRHIREEAQAAAEKMQAMTPAYRAAAGLPGGQGPAALAAGEAIATRTGLTREESTDIAIKAARENMLGDAELFARAQASRGLDAKAAIDTLDALKEQFPKAELTGRSFIEQVLETQVRTQSGDPNEIMDALKVVGPGMRRIGAGPEEMLTVMSALGERGATKQAKAALNRVIDALGEGVETETPAQSIAITGAGGQVIGYKHSAAGDKVRKTFGGKGLAGGIAAMEREAPEQFKKLMESDTAFNEGVTAIRSMPDYAGTLAAIRAAGRVGRRLEEGEKAAESIPQLQAARDLQRQKTASEQALDSEARDELHLRTVREEARRRDRRILRSLPWYQQPFFALGQGINEVVTDTAALFNGPKAAEQTIPGYVQSRGDKLSESADGLKSAASALIEAARQIGYSPGAIRELRAVEADREGKRR